MKPYWLFLVPLAVSLATAAERSRDLGVPFEGKPGAWNAITDVKGIEVGYRTLIAGAGAKAVRTGVTAVWPRGKNPDIPAFGGWLAQNGNGEMTGTTWLEEGGLLSGPVLITNTHSVGTVRDSFIRWQVGRARGLGEEPQEWSLPVVAETWDGFLNDINGFHVTMEDTVAALESAKSGPIEEGNVGGGTGMVCYGFKGGTGTSSRRVDAYTVGVLVQCILRTAGTVANQRRTCGTGDSGIYSLCEKRRGPRCRYRIHNHRHRH